MNNTIAGVVAACVVLAGGVAMLPASAQDRTQQPGQPTQGKVWIQNRGDTEAVPVSIQYVALASPLPVQVTGSPIVTMGSGSVVDLRVARQPWEYRTVSIAPGQDPASLLNTAGSEGWETTGVAIVEPGRTVVVMKRPNR